MYTAELKRPLGEPAAIKRAAVEVRPVRSLSGAAPGVGWPSGSALGNEAGPRERSRARRRPWAAALLEPRFRSMPRAAAAAASLCREPKGLPPAPARCRAHGVLRTPPPVARAQELLEKLALTDCRSVKIGNPLEKGISGGQAKRTNIGIALITNPR
jgi:hypothetical protein